MKIQLALVSSALLLSATAHAQAPVIGGCQVFPQDNIWNTPIDTLPVNALSAQWIDTINPTASAHADFTIPSEGGGIPYSIVPNTQAEVPITFNPGQAESDPGPYPIPTNQPIEKGSDNHILIMQQGNCYGYEVESAVELQNGASWTGYSGASFEYLTNNLRPIGWTSADAAGLPILPGLIRYKEVSSGAINHALRFTTSATLGCANYTCPPCAETYSCAAGTQPYLWPARHYASDYTNTGYPPMGARIRLKASVDISGEPPQTKVVLQALQTYGAFLADNGTSLYFQGVPNAKWNETDLSHFGDVHGSDFEFVDESSLMISVNSGQANPPPQAKADPGK